MENMQEKEVDLVLQVKLGPIFLKKKTKKLTIGFFLILHVYEKYT